MTPITDHPELPGYYESHGWSFSIDPSEDGSIEFAEQAIAAWTEWRDFLIQKASQGSQEPLF